MLENISTYMTQLRHSSYKQLKLILVVFYHQELMRMQYKVLCFASKIMSIE